MPEKTTNKKYKVYYYYHNLKTKTMENQKEYKIEFVSDISVESSYNNNYLGKFPSTMVLHSIEFTQTKAGYATIEWIVEMEDEEIVEQINICWAKGKVTEYDGVFALPKQVKKLLKLIDVKVPNNMF